MASHALDTEDTLVLQNHGLKRLVVTLGVKDLVIVDTGDALLICRRDRTQDVKDIVDAAKRKKLKVL